MPKPTVTAAESFADHTGRTVSTFLASVDPAASHSGRGYVEAFAVASRVFGGHYVDRVTVSSVQPRYGGGVLITVTEAEEFGPRAYVGASDDPAEYATRASEEADGTATVHIPQSVWDALVAALAEQRLTTD